MSLTGISVVVVKLLVCDRLGPPRKGLTLNPDSLGLKQAFEFISEEIELFAFICFRIRNTENPAIIMTFHGYRLDSACLRSYFQLLNRSNFWASTAISRHNSLRKKTEVWKKGGRLATEVLVLPNNRRYFRLLPRASVGDIKKNSICNQPKHENRNEYVPTKKMIAFLSTSSFIFGKNKGSSFVYRLVSFS